MSEPAAIFPKARRAGTMRSDPSIIEPATGRSSISCRHQRSHAGLASWIASSWYQLPLQIEGWMAGALCLPVSPSP
jgi:hypothetical protein